MITCAYCGKPKYMGDAMIQTTTSTSTVWPYCQCRFILRATISFSGTTQTGWIALKKRQEVPQAFQEAFAEGELDV